jgi:uncharacterized protein (DUF952 family)
MNVTEIKITDKMGIPHKLFHLVPKELFSKYLDKNGNYDCRKKQEWGMNSDFIHTTATRKDLKERVADMNWRDYPKEIEFVLLIINTCKIESDFTYVVYNGVAYYHIWGVLPKDSFDVSDIIRNEDGTFNI